MGAFEKVCAEVEKRVTPSQEERRKVWALAERIASKLALEAERAGLEAEVRVDGSVAKDTWLSGEADVDIFLRVPPSLPREAFGGECLAVARRALEGYETVERYADHPYLEGFVEGTRVNVVPCYKVEKGGWLSATDRTPFHTDFMKEKLTEALRREVRILKKFVKGAELYGAEVKVGGFSGFLCELLALNYGSFKEALRAASGWRRGQLIDVAGWFLGNEREALYLFDEPLIAVDPVDKTRNAAASVSERKFWEFVSASRLFLKNPSLKFFYPPAEGPLGEGEAEEKVKASGSSFLFLVFGEVQAVVDVLWGQLYRTENALKNLLRGWGFEVVRSASWSNEKNLNVILFELERETIQTPKRHMGPPVEKARESENFLKKHLGAEDTVAGPWVEDGRWVVEKKRRWSSAKELLSSALRDGGRSVGVAGKIAEKLRGGFRLLSWREAVGLYRAEEGFAKFFSKFLAGRPVWLEQA